MANLSRAIITASVLILLLTWHSSASAQALPTQEALVKLHKVAEQLIKDPGSEYRKDASPDFPRPTEIQAQYDAAWDAHGNSLTPEERKLFIPCAAHLKTAITDTEIGYRVHVTQPNNPPAQESAKKRLDEAPPEVAKCIEAYELAEKEIAASAKKP